MKKLLMMLVVILWFSVVNIVSGDTFGTRENQFIIDFVDISFDASSGNGMNISQYKDRLDHPGYRAFVDSGSYRIGTYEVTNDQWNKFTNINGIPTGSPLSAYDSSSYFTGANVPANNISWYETAQFVNWLNTSTGKPAAYKFTGTQGTSDYTFSVWQPGDAGYDPTNPFRNSNAYYFLPTEDEWVKAAAWNGTSFQEFPTKAGESLTQGNGINGSGWNYQDGGGGIDPRGPWAVGSGSEELNGTFDMLGNVRELIESPYYAGDYSSGSDRVYRGGGYNSVWRLDDFRMIYRGSGGPAPDFEWSAVGFRVASVIPEPCSLVLLSLGGLMLRRRRKA